jgi:hypothetical protein
MTASGTLRTLMKINLLILLQCAGALTIYTVHSLCWDMSVFLRKIPCEHPVTLRPPQFVPGLSLGPAGSTCDTWLNSNRQVTGDFSSALTFLSRQWYQRGYLRPDYRP